MIMPQDTKINLWKDLKKLMKKSLKAICIKIAEIIDFFMRHRKQILSASIFLLKCIWKLVKECRACLNGEDIEEYMVNPSSKLVEDDVVELSKRLDGRPYDTPTFNSWANNLGVARYEYCACGLAEKYKGLEMKDMAKICQYQIENYYMETRWGRPYVVIEVVTPVRLQFAVALSKHGQDLLEKQKNSLPSVIEHPAAILEEEIIDLSEDSDTEELW